ncbi:Os01g0828400 [Oryza sativa Japonica Group]|uniref:Os01g0828400 protein n=1 Tax=Oryza sativa subsp. japonica TaxID=39947 RepID=A0A0P0VA48_ORYSJ|nr:hypothetical protein EE612_006596 [Oryza sativa]BAS75035.1 Os01g0828400 [Oryza sativa Japonica Group]
MTFLSSKYPPKLATPHPTSRTVLVWVPHSIIYLLNKSNVFSHTSFKLSSTSRENKIIARLPNPVLVLLVFH